ncbi:MAG: VWA domain-containing protein [Candidatus Saccharicenans sp.]|nr:VWA domain-containing protein [Candidatus Saccharicenans sp.]
MKFRLTNGAESILAALILLLFGLHFPAVSLAQEETIQFRPKHEISVTLKLIQVYVTDSKGHPVTDLGKSDFEVYDNGQRKTITEFERHLHSFLLPQEKQESVPPASAETQEIASRKFFLLFDFVYNNPKGLRATREAALHFLDRISQPTDEVGIITYSLEGGLALREYLTRDHQKIRKFVESIGLKNYQSSVENLELRYWRQANDENPIDVSERGAVGAGIWSGSEKDPIMDLPNVSDEMKRAFMTSESRVQALTFLKEMTRLSRALSYIPGIKHLLLFSAGIPYSLFYGIQTQGQGERNWRHDWGQTQLQHYLEDMQKAISHANLVVYAFDTEDSAARINQDIRLTGILTLGKVADYSGGKYFGNIHNYSKGMEEVQQITGCYYVLGYYVDEKWDGQYHEIKVKVNRPRVKVYAQKGYFNPRPFNELSAVEKQLHLIDLCLSEKPVLQEPLTLKSGGFTYHEKGKENLILWTQLIRDEIEKLAGNKLELIFIVFDRESQIKAFERKKIKLSSLPETEAGSVYFSPPLEVLAGSYRCRVVIRNLENGKSALGSTDFTLGESRTEAMVLGVPLLLVYDQIAIFENTPAFFPPGISRYLPAGSMLKAGAEEFYLLTTCSSPAVESPLLEFNCIILRVGDSVTSVVPSNTVPVSATKKSDLQTYLLRIKTEPLPPGNYYLYLHATEKKTGTRATRNLQFSVSE